MREKVIKILSELSDSFEGYIGTDMLADEILDSFVIMELIAEIEDVCNIEIDAEDIVLANFKTVDTILALINKYVEADK